MTLTADPFEPLTNEEVAQATQVKKKSDKTPIIPVPDTAPDVNFKNPEWGKPVRMWAYRDPSGALLGYDGRFEKRLPDGSTDKAVLPIAYCDLGEGKAGWRQKMLPMPRSLYGLDRLAARPDAPVVIAEGAKSADAAGDLLPGYVAVSWQGGANAIGLSFWRSLENRNVLIWPDRDRLCDNAGNEKPYDEQPGNIAAENIVAKLRDVAASIHVLDLADHECKGGWDAADAQGAGWTPEGAAEFVRARAKLIDGNAPGTVMPFQFEAGEDGIYYVEGDANRKRLCGRLKLIAKTRDIDGSAWGLLLEWRDEDGRQHRWAMPKSLLAGDGSAIREHLLNHGLYVTTASSARSKLMEFLAGVDIKVRARAVSQVGWAGAAFALPELTIGDKPDDRVIYQQADSSVHQYQCAGSLEDWQKNVGTLALGNSRLIFAICTALVGPILRPANEEGGGFNFVGSSSSGKTTAMKAGASVWGPPSFIRQWRATSNGLEGVAQQHNETFLCLDELSQVEPKEAGSIAYMLGNGQGKSRASRTGASRAVSAWKLIFLSTGEVGLSDVMQEARQGRRAMAGQEVRILDVPADAGKNMGVFENIHDAPNPAAFARQISVASATYYGTPAIEFIRRVSDIRDTVGDAIAGTAEDFVERCVVAGADGQVQRGARRFGLVAAAGELAIALGVLPWPAGSAVQAARAMLRDWIGRRGGTGSAEDRNIIETIRLYLEQHGSSRFEPWVSGEDDHVRPVYNRAGFWRSDYDGVETERKFYILPTVFEQEICRGFDKRLAVKVLKQIGALREDSEGRPMRKERLPGDTSTTRVYVIGPEIFDAGD